MKKTTLSILALLCTIGMHAQEKRTVVRGRFKGDIPKTVSFQTYRSILDYIEGEHLTMETAPGPDGSFGFSIGTETPLNFHMLRDGDWLFYNKYLGPGDSLYIVFDKNSTTFEGRCEECIGFQFAYDRKFNNKDAVAAYQQVWKTLPKYAFAEYMKKRHDDHIRFFDEYFADKEYPALFKRTYIADEDLDFAIDMVQFCWRSQYGKNSLLDTSYRAYMKGLDFNNPEYFLSHRYGHFLRELPYGLWSCLETSRGTEYYKKNGLQIRDSIAKSYFKGKAYDYALYQILNDRIKGLEASVGEPGFDNFYRHTDTALTILGKGFNDKALYKRTKERLADIKRKNIPAPDFTATDMNGKTVHLSDYKGKVVYIDFWGINCAPCVAELPHIKKMQQKYKDNENLVLLYVCLDNKPYVEKFIKEKEFDGIHWYDGKSFASDAARKYKISSIPRYVLVNKKGMLVTANAPRPSNEPYELIDKTLEEN